MSLQTHSSRQTESETLKHGGSRRDASLHLDVPRSQADAALREGGKMAIAKLLELRRTMTGTEENFVLYVNACIEEIRSIINLTQAEKEERVLKAIEVSGATTLTEIREDCRLSREVTKTVLSSLGAKGLVYCVKKHVPGSDRPNFMYKSRRAKIPEAD